MNERGWAVVIANSGCEDIAERNIQRLGYEVDFLWRRKLIERRAEVNGHRVRVPWRDCIVRCPLFRPYGLVLLDYQTDTSDIDTQIGVHKVLRHPSQNGVAGQPKRILASLVETLRAACAAGEFDDAALKPKPALRDDLKPGSLVRIPGRMDGLIATIASIDEYGRSEYFVSLLGGTVPGRFTREETAKLELVDG